MSGLRRRVATSPHGGMWSLGTRLRWLAGTLSLVAVLASGVPGAHAGAGEPPLTFAGSGSNLGSMRLLVDAFRRLHPEITLDVPPSIGSSGGIRAAAEGAIAVGLVSRPFRGREKELGLTMLPYARTAVVIGAHPTVADDGITSDELLHVYKGTKSRWRDGREIIVLTREAGDSSIEVLERAIPGFREAHAESVRARRWIILYTDQEMSRKLMETPGAIGLSDLGAITAGQLPIKVLKVNGVAPTSDNVLGGRYPLVKTLAFVFLPHRPSPAAKAFMAFARSPEAARLLRVHGYLPPE